MGITFVINTGRSFVYRVGPTKSWLVMCHIVISMEKPVFMEIVRNPKDAPVILAGKNPLHSLFTVPHPRTDLLYVHEKLGHSSAQCTQCTMVSYLKTQIKIKT